MNAITKSISDIMSRIPREILEIGFRDTNNVVNNMVTIDEKIMTSVIRRRVLVDCNLVGGINTNIPLAACSIRMLDNYESIVTVPKTVTNNKSIMSVLSLVSTITSNHNNIRQGFYNNGVTEVMGIANNMVNNLSAPEVAHTSRLELIADNTILIQDSSINLHLGTLRCILENSTNLENINPRNYLSFSELVTRATKAYIYNNTIVKLDKGYIYGGHELGMVKDIIDGYSDMEEMYMEYLTTTWKQVAFINNSESMDRYLKMMLSNTM